MEGRAIAPDKPRVGDRSGQPDAWSWSVNADDVAKTICYGRIFENIEKLWERIDVGPTSTAYMLWCLAFINSRQTSSAAGSRLKRKIILQISEEYPVSRHAGHRTSVTGHHHAADFMTYNF